MTYENFLKVLLELQKQSRILDTLYKANVDLVNFVDPYYGILQTLIEEIYGEEGHDWFSWYCFDNDFGTKGLQAWDKNKNAICYSHETLWQYLEELRTGQS